MTIEIGVAYNLTKDERNLIRSALIRHHKRLTDDPTIRDAQNQLGSRLEQRLRDGPLTPDDDPSNSIRQARRPTESDDAYIFWVASEAEQQYVRKAAETALHHNPLPSERQDSFKTLLNELNINPDNPLN